MIDGSTTNILRVYNSASETSRQEGRDWYTTAFNHALHIGKGHASKGAGILAALSPRNPWPRNILYAHMVSDGNTPPGLPDSTHKALMIGNTSIDPLEVLRGLKVRDFYNAILIAPYGPPVIDVHAASVWHGSPITDRRQLAHLQKEWQYKTIQDAYNIVARDLNILPAVLQATTWVEWRKSSS